MKIIITEKQYSILTESDKSSRIVEKLWLLGHSIEEISNATSIPFWRVVTILKDHDMEIDCEMAYDLIRDLFQKTSFFTKEVITDKFGFYLIYSSFEGAIEYEYKDDDCIMLGYATPYWNQECFLPIENVSYTDKKDDEEYDFEPSKTIKLPERFDNVDELIKWFNDNYIKYLIRKIKEFKKDF